MNGLKMITMSIDEMHAAHERGDSKTDFAALHQYKSSGIEPSEDEDSPDLTLVMREAMAKRRAARLIGSSDEEQVAIRFDKDILEAFRSTGKGWQTRMNDALKEWLKEHELFS
jgi:uncharacterized protein (DUF4415 family)